MNEADPLESLRRRSSEKWGTFPADVLPMFVAEMDFGLPPEIRAALLEAAEAGDTGYVNPRDTSPRPLSPASPGTPGAGRRRCTAWE